MELAGLVLAGPTVVSQLISCSLSGYRVITESRLAGTDLRHQQREIELVQERLWKWAKRLQEHGGDLEALLGSEPRLYYLTLETLNLIAKVLVSVEEQRGRYDGSIGRRSEQAIRDDASDVGRVWTIKNHGSHDRAKTESRREGFRTRLINRLRSRRISIGSSHSQKVQSDLLPLTATANVSTPRVPLKSPASEPARSPKFSPLGSPVRSRSPAETPGEMGQADVLALSESLEVSARGANDVMRKMEQQAQEYQNAMTLFQQYKWVFVGKEQLDTLIKDLKRYTDDLETLTNAAFSAPLVPIQPQRHFDPYNVPLQIPFSRDPKFTGREDVLSKIATILDTTNTNRTSVVLHGMGGIGKSMISLEFVYRHHSSYSGVFWIDAKNKDTINSSAFNIMCSLVAHYATRYEEKPDFMRIATELGIPGQLDATGQLVSSAVAAVWSMVKAWLAREENRRWLLIIDGCDCDSLGGLVPPCGHGHVVVTSRLRTTAGSIGAELIDIQEIERQSALELLLKGVGKKLENLDAKARDAAEKIIDILGALPLALAQASAYMQATARDFVEYLEKLSDDLSRAVSRPFSSYPDGVFTCWKLSVETLNAKNPDAALLLTLCSFLSGDGVPEELLFRGIGTIGWLENDKSRLEDAIDDLIKFSLMKRKTFGDGRSLKALYIHPLVHRGAQESKFDNGTLVQEHGHAKILLLKREGAMNILKLISTAIEVESHKRKSSDWVFEKTILSHISLCYEYINQFIPESSTQSGDADVAQILWKFGHLDFHWNRFARSIKLLEQAIRMYKSIPSPSYQVQLDLLQTEERLLSFHVLRGPLDPPLSYETCLTRLNTLIATATTLLGNTPDHRLLLGLLETKAICLRHLTRYSEALPIHLSVLHSSETTLGCEDPDTVGTIHNLALLYEDLGDLKTAEKYYHSAYTLFQKIYGPQHWETLTGLRNMALMYASQRDYAKAITMLLQAKEGMEETLGDFDYGTIRVYGDLVECYMKVGRYHDALQLARKERLVCSVVFEEESEENRYLRWLVARLERLLSGEEVSEPETELEEMPETKLEMKLEREETADAKKNVNEERNTSALEESRCADDETPVTPPSLDQKPMTRSSGLDAGGVK